MAEEKPLSKEEKSEAGKALAKSGAQKGGRARANVLTKSERSEIARRAALKRWGKDPENQPEPTDELDASEAEVSEPPYSMFPGELEFGGVKLECHVLNTGQRVLTQREMVRVISGGRESGNLTRYLQRNPLTANSFDVGPDVHFRIPGQAQLAHGFEATKLIEICDLYLAAREQGLLKGSQRRLADQAEIVVRACAKVGIIALIDEATGYQKHRAKRDLQLKLQAFIADEMQEWARMFPEEFWLELARLEGVRYSPRNRPLRWGRYVMMFVYDAIDKDVGRALRRKNPNPRFLRNHHQWLRKFGRSQVHDQITKVVTIMKLCDNMEEFREKFQKLFKTNAQLSFDDINWGALA